MVCLSFHYTRNTILNDILLSIIATFKNEINILSDLVHLVTSVHQFNINNGFVWKVQEYVCFNPKPGLPCSGFVYVKGDCAPLLKLDTLLVGLKSVIQIWTNYKLIISTYSRENTCSTYTRTNLRSIIFSCMIICK